MALVCVVGAVAVVTARALRLAVRLQLPPVRGPARPVYCHIILMEIQIAQIFINKRQNYIILPWNKILN